MNAEEFEKVVGVVPVHDDLARVNCVDAGKVGHVHCGLCEKCGRPKFCCVCIRIIPDNYNDYLMLYPRVISSSDVMNE
jgi:hypothetical protein